jgi:hypothetical protein
VDIRAEGFEAGAHRNTLYVRRHFGVQGWACERDRSVRRSALQQAELMFLSNTHPGSASATDLSRSSIGDRDGNMSAIRCRRPRLGPQTI